MARIDLGTVNATDAKLILRAVRAEPKLQWYADLLEADLNAAPTPAPWRKVTGKERGKTGVAHFDLLECGHRYMLRYTRNWQEDHAIKRRCKQCLREGHTTEMFESTEVCE